MSSRLVLFTGYNDRANIAILRAASERSVSCSIVALTTKDVIFETSYNQDVFYVRSSSKLEIKIFKDIYDKFKLRNPDSYPALLTTSEFLNYFIYLNKDALELIGWFFLLPPKAAYDKISNKASSVKWMRGLQVAEVPAEYQYRDVEIPCIAKPRLNIMGGRSLYPRFLKSREQLREYQFSHDDYFFQEVIKGQSFYFCGFLAPDGSWASYWQENLLQQAGGKSVVLARSCDNPGIEVGQLIGGLIELGFYGPFMVEFILSDSGRFYFIEVNPRFWGPLELGRLCCPTLFDICFHEIELGGCFYPLSRESSQQTWYSWGYGGSFDCRIFPAIKSMERSTLIEALKRFDLYRFNDTRGLHMRF